MFQDTTQHYPSFQPTINKKSRRVASALTPLVDRQFAEQSKRRERLEALSDTVNRERDREATFAPRLSRAPSYLDVDDRVPLAERAPPTRSFAPLADPEATHRPKINSGVGTGGGGGSGGGGSASAESAQLEMQCKRQVRDLWKDYADGPSMSVKGILNVLKTFGIEDDTRPDLVDKFLAAMNIDEGDPARRYVAYDRFLKVMVTVVRAAMEKTDQHHAEAANSAMAQQRGKSVSVLAAATQQRPYSAASGNGAPPVRRASSVPQRPTATAGASAQRGSSVQQPQRIGGGANTVSAKRSSLSSSSSPSFGGSVPRRAFSVEDEEDEDDEGVGAEGSGWPHGANSRTPNRTGGGLSYFSSSSATRGSSVSRGGDADDSPSPQAPRQHSQQQQALSSSPLSSYAAQQRARQSLYMDPYAPPAASTTDSREGDSHQQAASDKPTMVRAHSQPPPVASAGASPAKRAAANANSNASSSANGFATFRPAINPMSHSEALLARREQQGGLGRSRVSDKGAMRQQQLQEELEARERGECSFAPKTLKGIDPRVASLLSAAKAKGSTTSSVSPSSSTARGDSVHSHGLSMSPPGGSSSAMRRSSSSTPAPKQQQQRSSSSVRASSSTSTATAGRAPSVLSGGGDDHILIQMPADPPGFDKAVRRLAEGRARAVPKFEDGLRSIASQRPSSTAAAVEQLEATLHQQQQHAEPTEPKPFALASEARQQERAQRKPLLYVDVNLPHGRMGRIGVYQGDDPATLAHNFCVTYGLDTDALAQLTVMLQQKIDITLRANAIRKVWA